MKKILLLLLLAPVAFAQSPARYDMPVMMTTPGQNPVGSLPPLLAVTNATIAVCGYPAVLSGGSGTHTMCTNTITTYTDSTLGTACPASAQLTAPGTSVCVSTTGLQGAFGFWYDAAVQSHLTYTLKTSWGIFGPFEILPGGGSRITLQTNGTPNASQSTLNFSNTTPVAPAGYTNVLWQNSGGNESAYVAQTSSTAGAQCFLGTAGLVGAFTDSSGVVKQPLCIGNGPTSLQVPTGATQLLLGVDDNKFSDNGGSFVISASVNGGTATQYTVQSTSEPWDVTTNPSYTYGTTGGTAPILGPTGLNPGDTVTITYVSGTVSCYAGTKPNVDANGYLTTPPGNADCAGGPTGTYVDPTYGKFPTYYMGSGGGATFNALTAAATGGAAPGATFNGSAPVTFDYHSFGAAPTASPTFTGTVTMPAPTLNNVTGSTQCLHVNTSGVVSGTGSDCGSGSSGVTQIIAGTNVTISPAGGTGAVTINASGGGGGSLPTATAAYQAPLSTSAGAAYVAQQIIPFDATYTVWTDGTTVYARNESTGAVQFSSTDAAVVLNDALTQMATTGGTIFIKKGAYNCNSATQETVSPYNLYYCVGIPSANSGTVYPNINIVGETDAVGSQSVPPSAGVIFNVTTAAESAAGAGNTLAAFWMRPSTATNTHFGSLYWNDHISFSHIAITFPSNTRGNEYAIDAIEASYLQTIDVSAGFVTQPTALGAANLTAFITPGTPADGVYLRDTMALPGWNAGFDVNAEHNVLINTLAYENTTGYRYGQEMGRNGGPIYHSGQWIHPQVYDCVNGISTGADVADKAQLDILGLDLEYTTGGTWAYSTGFTTNNGSKKIGGFLSWDNILSFSGIGSLTTPFPTGNGTGYLVEQNGTCTGCGSLSGPVTAQSFLSTAPNNYSAQGGSLQWNIAVGGETDFVNYKGNGGGGWNWYNLSTAGTPGNPAATLTSAGSNTSFTLHNPANTHSLAYEAYDGGNPADGIVAVNGNNVQNYATITGGFALSLINTAVMGWTTSITSAPDTGFSRDSAGVIDVGSGTLGSKTGSLKLASVIPGVLYSASGTPLPTCGSSIQGASAVVSDATAPSYMGDYTSGGAITTAVICSYDGTTYSWKTH